MENNKNVASEKINAAIEQFEMLKDNFDNFSLREKLELASTIRGNLSTDKGIGSACLENPKLLEKRKRLLDSINKVQMDLIQENIRKDKDVSFSKCRVVNFDKAKLALSEMIDEELASNMFSEDDSPEIYKSIKECDTHVNTLKQVYSECKYGKYKVLLMGDFQSGKTTTFDAFCDGRHIGAIGKGAATSAVLISATYAEKESMIIHWRQKKQFQVIFDRIKQYLQEFDWESFDLDNASLRDQLFNEIETLRQSKNCPDVGKGDSKFLALCSFVLKYYGTEKLDRKKSSLQAMSEISEITRFPDNGECLWKKTGVANFSIDEIIFIFIDRVDCFIPSNILKELNCTILDSPGLFNSSYDTAVTEMAMREANAIMYILPYYKGMGKDICQSLFTIKDNYPDVHRKLFIVNNLKFTDDNEFYKSNCEQIKGLFTQEKFVSPYDGKLAYLVQLKKLYSLGLALESDYCRLMTVEAKKYFGKKENLVFEDFDAAYDYQVKKYELEGKTLDEILEMSGFDKMVKALKQFIAYNEAYAVIVSNGLAPMRHEMVSIVNSLFRSYIEPYISSHDDLVKLWEHRVSIATSFQEYVRLEVRKNLFESQNGHSSLLVRMVEEEYLKTFTNDFYTRLSKEISGVLYDKKKELLGTKTLFKSDKTKFKERFAEISSPLIEAKILELVKYEMDKLAGIIESGQDKTVENMFAPIIDKLEITLIKDWKKINKEDEGVSMKDYLVLSRNLDVYKKNGQSLTKYGVGNLAESNLSGSLLGGLVAEISTIVAGVATMVVGYVSAILCDITGVSQLLTAILLGFGGLVVVAGGPEIVRNKFINILSEKIDDKVRLNAGEGFKKIVKAHFEETFNQYVNNLSIDINKLKNERDLALTSNQNQESLCFKALEASIYVHEQIKKYDEYKTIYLKNETN